MECITRQQLENINNKCSNGWKLDTFFYQTHSEKTLTKQIQTDDEHYLEFRLRYNLDNQITLHISNNYHKKGEYFAVSDGLGKNRILDEIQAPRRNLNKLIDFTKELTDTELLEINKNTKVASGYGLILPSEDF